MMYLSVVQIKTQGRKLKIKWSFYYKKNKQNTIRTLNRDYVNVLVTNSSEKHTSL